MAREPVGLPVELRVRELLLVADQRDAVRDAPRGLLEQLVEAPRDDWQRGPLGSGVHRLPPSSPTAPRSAIPARRGRPKKSTAGAVLAHPAPSMGLLAPRW